jgi:hypothetical protein
MNHFQSHPDYDELLITMLRFPTRQEQTEITKGKPNKSTESTESTESTRRGHTERKQGRNRRNKCKKQEYKQTQDTLPVVNVRIHHQNNEKQNDQLHEMKDSALLLIILNFDDYDIFDKFVETVVRQQQFHNHDYQLVEDINHKNPHIFSIHPTYNEEQGTITATEKQRKTEEKERNEKGSSYLQPQR